MSENEKSEFARAADYLNRSRDAARWRRIWAIAGVAILALLTVAALWFAIRAESEEDKAKSALAELEQEKGVSKSRLDELESALAKLDEEKQRAEANKKRAEENEKRAEEKQLEAEESLGDISSLLRGYSNAVGTEPGVFYSEFRRRQLRSGQGAGCPRESEAVSDDTPPDGEPDAERRSFRFTNEAREPVDLYWISPNGNAIKWNEEPLGPDESFPGPDKADVALGIGGWVFEVRGSSDERCVQVFQL